MKKTILVALLALCAFDAFAQKPQAVLGPGLSAGRTEYHQSFNRTLSNDTVYVLTGMYFIDSTKSLTIPAGTLILGDTAATLIVKRGGYLIANGSAAEPIVFTSSKPAGGRAPGDWGGIVMLGNAPVNKVEPTIEGGIVAATYGGSDADDSSGALQYVRIEFAGYRFQLNNEINGLTLGGVGRKTKIEYVQVSYAFDDSFEFFGGTVDARYLVAFGGTDDDFDTDFGYSGRIQFAFGYKDPAHWDAAGESNGFESDNDGSGTTAAPRTAPLFSNVTLVGPRRDNSVTLTVGHKFQYAAVLRRATNHSIYNSIMMGYPFGISVRDAATTSDASSGALQVRNVSLQAENNILHTNVAAFDVAAWYNTSGYNNMGATAAQPNDIGLVDMSLFTAPDPRPASGSALASAPVDFANPKLSGEFFTAASYRGAFDPALSRQSQWDYGWTNYDPNNTNYVTSVGNNAAELPKSFTLEQNYPNPFNPSTVVRYNVPATGFVRLVVYDALGREIARLADGVTEAGAHSVVFNASSLPSGVYFAAMSYAGATTVRKMMLMK